MDLAFVTPSPAQPGGGSAFNAGLIPALRELGHRVTEAATLPLAGTPVVDGLTVPDFEPELDTLVARDAVVVVHHASARAGREEAAREAVRAIERRMLPAFRRVVATSAPVAERLAAEFGVAEPIVLAPGLPVLPRSTGSAASACAILAVGVLTPRKGHDRLLRALARLVDLDWTLTIAGDAERDPVHAASIDAAIEELGLRSRVIVLAGSEDGAIEHLWRDADLFALATAWEGYPAAAAQALRRGLPIVATRVAGIEAVVPAAAGILFPPDDPATFGKCLRRAIFDTTLRRAMAEAAWEAGQALPSWTDQAHRFETILKG